ncbi:MAG: hypothetical protein QF664_00275 [Dehalococcoidia bacterium]|jgi:hypothetical protein|nr:hypothetical protein [Dehalococcoidia bacterium]
MHAVATGPREPSWVMLAVAREAETAERWADALDQRGIDVKVRIDDAVALTNGSSFWPTASPGGHRLFAYPLFVPAEARAEAAAVLVDEGWDGRHGQSGGGIDPGVILRGAIAARLVGGAVAVVLMLRGG